MEVVRENCRRVEYTADVNTHSALFRVRDTNYCPEFFNLSLRLNEESSRLQYYEPEEGEVFSYYDGSYWHRARLIEKYGTRCHFKLRLFLIDSGVCDDVTYLQNSCKPLPEWFSPNELDSQSYIITLYGVIPLASEIRSYGPPIKKRYDNWLPFHLNFMRSQLERADGVYFNPICKEGEIEFGHIYLDIDGEFIALHELLVSRGSAEKCADSYFEENIIPNLIKCSRSIQDFDYELSVRQSLYPSVKFCDGQSSVKFCDRPSYVCDRATREYDLCSKTSSASDLSNYMSDRSNSPVEDRYEEEDRCEEEEYEEVAMHSEKQFPPSEERPSDRTSDYNSDIRTPSPATSYCDINLEEPDMFEDAYEEILVVGNESRLKPTPFIHTSPLDSVTREMMMKVQLRDLNVTQSYLIPAMFSKKDVIMIDRPRSGKTSGCLMGLVSLLRASNDKKRPGMSPRSLYIVPYASKCEIVQNRCVELIAGKDITRYDEDLDRKYGLRVTVAYGCGEKLERDKMFQIAAGYDILICTPKCLLRYMRKESSSFNLDRLEYIIFDDYHTLRKMFDTQLVEITQRIRDLEIRNLRKVYLSNSMTAEMKRDIDILAQRGHGLVLMPCYLEAALYARFEFAVDYRPDTSKVLDEITQFLTSKNLISKNVVIVLNDDDESLDQVEELYDRLESLCRKPIYKITTVEPLDNDEIVNNYQDDVSMGKGPVLICPDEMLESLNKKIYNADVLIHYNLPKKMMQFRKRFSVLLRRTQKLAHQLAQPNSSNRTVEKPIVRCFISDTVDVFPRLFKMMSQLRDKPTVPEWIQEKLSLIQNEKEMSRTDFCLNLKQFGVCNSETTCHSRHVILPEKDAPNPLLPKSGLVNINITHVYSPSHFRARIVETKVNGKWVPSSIPDGKVVDMKLALHFQNNVKIAVDNVREGDILVTEYNEPDSIYSDLRRVRVLKFVEGGKIKKALVKCIDHGNEMVKPLWSLSQLPPELADIPETTFDVFVSNIQPIDEDIDWGSSFTNIIENEIRKCRTNNKYYKFLAEVQLVIGDCMWLNTIQLYAYRAVLKEFVAESFSVTRFLLREKLASKNEQHLEPLRKKCAEAGLLNMAGDRNNTASESSSPPQKSNTLNSAESNLPIEPSKEETKENTSSPQKSIIVNSSNLQTRLCRKALNESITLNSAQSNSPTEPSSPQKSIIVNSAPSSLQTRLCKKALEEITLNSVQSNLPTSSLQTRLCRKALKSITVDSLPSNLPSETSKEALGKSNSSPKNSTTQQTQENSAPSSQKSVSPLRQPNVSPPIRENRSQSSDKPAAKPSVLWRQDKEYIYMTIQKNIEDYTLETDGRRQLFFDGFEGNTRYSFDISLMACMDANTLQHYKGGVTICIKFAKLSKDENWPKLVRSIVNEKWIKEELSYDDDDSSCDEDEEFKYKPLPEDLTSKPRSHIDTLKKSGFVRYGPDDSDLNDDDSQTDYSDYEDGMCDVDY